jgi:hypothetical protein
MNCWTQPVAGVIARSAPLAASAAWRDEAIQCFCSSASGLLPPDQVRGRNDAGSWTVCRNNFALGGRRACGAAVDGSDPMQERPHGARPSQRRAMTYWKELALHSTPTGSTR